MATVIGIDQSYTSCGIVVLQDEKLVHHERVISPVAMDVYDRARYLSQHINHVVDTYTDHGKQPMVVPAIGIEGLAFGMRGSATRDLAGLLFVIITSLRDGNGNLQLEVISPLSVKKFATGRGKAEKKELFEALPSDVKEIFESTYKKTKGLFDITDAYWIARFRQSSLDKNTDK